MMKKSNKTLFRGALVFTVSAVGFVCIIACIIAIVQAVKGNNVIDYFTEQWRDFVFVVISLIILSAITYCYLYFENSPILHRTSKIIEMFILFALSFILCFILGEFISASARPLTFFAMMAVTIFGRRDAIFLNTIFALFLFMVDTLTGIMTVYLVQPYTILLVTFAAGIMAIFLFYRIKTRFACVLLSLVLFIPVEIIIAILEFSKMSNYQTMLTLMGYGALNCIFSAIVYLFFLPVFEFLFSELTVFRLRELTADDSKLIKKMKDTAPGTYNHSVVVAQIVEACAKEIGENSELARAAAFYHDVGKLKNPEMFAENQGEYDMHTELAPELSVDIIRSHTKDGAMLIKKNHLPEFFADVAVQHHGTLPIKYFYAKALKMTDGEIKLENFSYAGPTPTSKIAAMIMIADASEAACRSLKDRSAENVESLVRGLIEERLDLGQFDNCDVTMYELTVIKHTIVDQLTGVYHSRISYPKIKISKRK